jgi:antitoxin component YwqK of YwqJK toxin-antitoxin module
MTRKLIFVLLLLQSILHSQTDSTNKHYYLDGRLKFIATWKGKDTVQFIKYYKNGQIKDSVWLYIPKNTEIPFGTERKYYENGHLSSVTYYGNNRNNYRLLKYRNNGSLQRDFSNPGIHKVYSKSGKIKKQFDINKGDQVFVPRKNRKQRHLVNTPFYSELQYKSVILSKGSEKIKLQSNKLITLEIEGDTSALRLCNIEGFKPDSMIVSKFEYDTTSSRQSLKYDSTFTIAFKNIQTIYYSKKNTHRRYIIAQSLVIIGADLFIIPVILAPIFGAPALLIEPFYFAYYCSGIPIGLFGESLYKKMIPKKYDMKEYKIILKN